MSIRLPLRLALSLLLAVASAAGTAADWPTKTVRFVVPYPVGGGVDLLARMVGPKVSEALKQPVIVENRLGAAGAIAVDHVVKSPADGHTVLFDSLSLVINPHISSSIPYDPLRDLQPVAKLISQAFIIVANPDLPAKTLKEVIAYSMTQPQGLNAAVPGASTALAAELFKLTTKARLTFVPYKGGPPAAVSVVSGETHIGFSDVPSVAQHVLSGRARGLAVSSDRRLALLPGVPTSAEAGVPEYRVESWLGSFAPANTPAEIVQRLNAEINAALRSPEISSKVGLLGAEVSPMTVSEFGDVVRKDSARWKDVVVRANVKIN